MRRTPGAGLRPHPISETQLFVFYFDSSYREAIRGKEKKKLKINAARPHPMYLLLGWTVSWGGLAPGMGWSGSWGAPCVSVCVFAVGTPCMRVGSYIPRKKKQWPPAADFVRAAFYFVFWESYAKDNLKRQTKEKINYFRRPPAPDFF